MTEEEFFFEWLKEYYKREIDPNKESFTDDFGKKIVNVHRQKDCVGACTIHNHGKHPLDQTAVLWRNDRGIFEHICLHGIGHPCPDSLSPEDSGIHGCDGCCNESN